MKRGALKVRPFSLTTVEASELSEGLVRHLEVGKGRLRPLVEFHDPERGQAHLPYLKVTKAAFLISASLTRKI
jgi:hypothetical protein